MEMSKDVDIFKELFKEYGKENCIEALRLGMMLCDGIVGSDADTAEFQAVIPAETASDILEYLLEEVKRL